MSAFSARKRSRVKEEEKFAPLSEASVKALSEISSEISIEDMAKEIKELKKQLLGLQLSQLADKIAESNELTSLCTSPERLFDMPTLRGLAESLVR